MHPILEKYIKLQKLEQNAIARAIALNHSTPDPRENDPLHTTEPRQLAPDANSANMLLAHLKMTEHTMLANRSYRLVVKLNERSKRQTGAELQRTLEAIKTHTAIAVKHDSIAEGAETRHRQLSRELENSRRLGSGRHSRGSTYHLTIDGVRHTFEFLLVWSEDGSRLEIANAREISVCAGLEHDSRAWRDLENWVNEFEESQRRGRPLENADSLIWRDTGDRLRVRDYVERDYRYITNALHAICCTVRN